MKKKTIHAIVKYFYPIAAGIETNMFNAKLISSYTYLIDSARRKKDRAIWDKKQALKNGLLKERSTFKTLLETSKKTGLH